MKRALVTGGSGDIGSVICVQLALAGLHVIVHANSDLERAQAVANQIISAGGSAEAISFDVTDTVACQKAIETLLGDGAIQVIVNNAGIHDDAIMAGMKTEQWQKVIDVSLNGFFNVTQPPISYALENEIAKKIDALGLDSGIYHKIVEIMLKQDKTTLIDEEENALYKIAQKLKDNLDIEEDLVLHENRYSFLASSENFDEFSRS